MLGATRKVHTKHYELCRLRAPVTYFAPERYDPCRRPNLTHCVRKNAALPPRWRGTFSTVPHSLERAVWGETARSPTEQLRQTAPLSNRHAGAKARRLQIAKLPGNKSIKTQGGNYKHTRVKAA